MTQPTFEAQDLITCPLCNGAGHFVDDQSFFGSKVREIRNFNGMTQDALAKEVKLSRASISNIEAGRQTVTLRFIKAFAKALNVETSALLP